MVTEDYYLLAFWALVVIALMEVLRLTYGGL